MVGEPNHSVASQQVRQSPAALMERQLAEILTGEREKVVSDRARVSARLP
jgi:hypothetical protein